mmetsp:Transcript_27155/g.71457  ORF Transcript_27155/g.71457 Transcript_27155/m.71457 type:complete len:277 (-) Transcript_27155:3087-3917(-)
MQQCCSSCGLDNRLAWMIILKLRRDEVLCIEDPLSNTAKPPSHHGNCSGTEPHAKYHLIAEHQHERPQEHVVLRNTNTTEGMREGPRENELDNNFLKQWRNETSPNTPMQTKIEEEVGKRTLHLSPNGIELHIHAVGNDLHLGEAPHDFCENETETPTVGHQEDDWRVVHGLRLCGEHESEQHGSQAHGDDGENRDSHPDEGKDAQHNVHEAPAHAAQSRADGRKSLAKFDAGQNRGGKRHDAKTQGSEVRDPSWSRHVRGEQLPDEHSSQRQRQN